MQQSGGLLLPPVQKLVATLIFIPIKGMKMQIESLPAYHVWVSAMIAFFSQEKSQKRCALGKGLIFLHEFYIIY